MTTAEKRRSPHIRDLIAFSTLVMLIFSMVVAFQAAHAYKIAIAEAKENGARLVRIMSQQVELTFLGVDNTLHRAVERQYYNDLFGNNLPDYILHNMQLWVDESPRIAAMILIDEKGEPVVAAHKKEYEHWLDYEHHSFAKDDVFKHLQDGSDIDYFIGKASSFEGKNNLIMMGHKVTKMDGSFGGVFIAVIDPEFFIQYFRSVDQGTKSYISLQLNSGALLVDNPIEGIDHHDINHLALTQLRDRPQKNMPGVGVDIYKLNGTIQIYAFQALKSLPIVVTVALNEDDYLKAWRQSCLKDIGFLAIFTVFGSVLSFFALTMARQIVRVEESEAAAVLASQAKSEFLANMSHELRTPLNAIIGFSEMMNSGYFGPLNSKQKERVHDINLCGSHLLHLITDILEFSKGDAGKLELVQEKVNFQEIVSEAMRMMHEKIKMKRMNLLVEVDEKLPDILGDKRKIRQILLNLLSNSLKFTPEDGTIKISVKHDTHHNTILTVSDTGCGIAEADIPVALSVFGQVHRSQSHEGTGLGLPLCKMFTELHGGKLALGSTLGEGTTVRITFPAALNLTAESN